MIEINKNYNESNLETMVRIPDNHIDLVVTSPPYDNLRTYNGYSFDFENVAKELFRVTKQGGIVVWVVGDATINGSESGTSFKQALYFMQCGFKLHDTMIYETDKPPLTHNRYEQRFEFMFILCKGKLNTFNPIKIPCKHAGIEWKARKFRANSKAEFKQSDIKTSEHKVKGNVWYYPTNSSTNGNVTNKHPATFPEQLANDHILSWSNEGDLVYDPFMGSGTTAKMAIVNNRNWIGSEISEEYVELANKRLDTYLRQTALSF